MYRALSLLVMLVPLFGESIGTLSPTGHPPRAAVSALPQFIADLAELQASAPDAPAGFLTPEQRAVWQAPDESLNGPIAGLAAEFVPTIERDVYLMGSDAANGSAGSSVALTICLIMIVVFLRDYLLGRTHCPQREQLKEHLALARRKLENAHARRLMVAYEEAEAEGELAIPAQQARMIENQIQTHEMARRRHLDAQKMLREHRILATRDLQSESRHPAGELVRRRQEIDLLEGAMAGNRNAAGSDQRESADLREHLVIANRRLEAARAAWLQGAFTRAAQTDPEVAVCQEEVTLLAMRMEDHCRLHGCRERHVTVQSLAGAGLTV